MIRTPDPGQHLTDLAGALMEADAAGDASQVGALCWQLLLELGTAAYARIETEATLAQLLRAAQAAVAAAADGAADPLSHVRHVMEVRGWHPVPGAAAAAILAGGSPARARRGRRCLSTAPVR